LIRFDGEGVETAEAIGPGPDARETVFLFVKHWSDTKSAFGWATITGPQTAPAPDPNKDISLLKRRPFLARAARYLREEPGWYGYWKAAEALGNEIGGLDEIVRRGWASEDQWKRWAGTVNYHRHHRKSAPSKPMPEDEVRSLLHRWLRRCLDWRLSAGR
jgi:hypothetical protein